MSIITELRNRRKHKTDEDLKPKVEEKSGLNYVRDMDEDTKEEIVNLVIDNYEDDLRSRADLEEVWDDSFKRWLGKTSDKRGPWDDSSDLRMPITGIAIETYHPRIMDAIWGILPIVHVKARNKKSQKNRDVVQEFMNWETLEEMDDLRDTCDDSFHSCLVYGTAIQKAYWYKDWEEVEEDQIIYEKDDLGLIILDENNDPIPSISPKTGRPRTKRVKVRHIEERPKVDHIDIDDFICPLITKDIQKNDHVIHRLFLTEDYLRRLEKSKRFIGVDEVIQAGPQRFNIRRNRSRLKETKRRALGLSESFRFKSNERFVVLEYYGRYDINKDGLEEECVFWVDVESRTILRAKLLRDVFKHGRRPFTVYKFIRVENQFYGIGIPQFLESIQDELDAIHNQRVDAGTIANIPFGFYRPATGFDPDDIEFGPGVWIPVDDINDVKFGQFPDVKSSQFNEENLLLSYYERLIGVNDNVAGRSDPTVGTRATFRGTATLIGESNIRFDLIIKRFQASFRRLLKQILKLNQQYMPEGKEIRVLGPKGRDFFKRRDRSDIAGDFDFILMGNSRNTNARLRAEAAQGLYQVMIGNPLLAKNVEGFRELTRILVESFAESIPGLDIDKVIPRQEEETKTDDQNKENMLVISNSADKIVAEPTDDHQEHLIDINTLKNSRIWSRMSSRQRAIIEDHESQHLNLLRQVRDDQRLSGIGLPGGRNRETDIASLIPAGEFEGLAA